MMSLPMFILERGSGWREGDVGEREGGRWRRREAGWIEREREREGKGDGERERERERERSGGRF